MTRACAWDLPMRWWRDWEIFAMWTCCLLPPFWTCPLIYRRRTSLRASASDSWSTARFSLLKANGISRWKCLTHICRAACLTRKCELDMDRLPELESDIARQIAGALNRPLGPVLVQQRPRYSRDPLAYAEFMRGYRLSATGDPATMEKAMHHLTSAVTRDPAFALAHATLSLACTTRHFEYDPASVWLEKAEFHCRRALEIDPELPEGHVARAFLLWGPSKNFQHLEAIAELKRALALQNNLPHAYNRLGTILAHIGLLDHARAMYERGSQFHPKKAVSPSIVQVYIWNQEYDAGARGDSSMARGESRQQVRYLFCSVPGHDDGRSGTKQKSLLDEALQLLADDPIITSLQGVFYALTGKHSHALDCMNRACASPKSFGHAHHTYYQIACILALAGQHETCFCLAGAQRQQRIRLLAILPERPLSEESAWAARV